MGFLDRAVALSLPLVPKSIVRSISKRYIAGETLGEAVQCVRQLNDEGAMATVDVLGEDITESRQADETVDQYFAALDAIREHGLDCNISIKLTALGLKLDARACRDRFAKILNHARDLDTFVRIDMEDSSVTSATLDLYRTMRETHGNVGVVLQAYLRRTETDTRALLNGRKLNIRLCKGIYREPPELAFQNRDRIRRSYQELLASLLGGGAYVGIATHDEILVDQACELIADRSLDRYTYEFQMLLGVLPELRRRLIQQGHRLRVYVPYGACWYDYSVRRLRENPKIAGYVFRDLFRSQ